ncbi:Ger(x)C family spore germination protein [Paenibacillus sp. LMG 31460]|uniref:Ger(X)C family spore germination protein n=1 Tax=Paenibacillus germinis TaxID=2654979 RepID=A0ABX1Z0S9_9BACL|nr:Ger(x)C family spore germination protein [Paenibacillus germinis]NOU87015.1 Ger(x)C family spore germination protein [Paenibacillus germinis]
MPKRIISFMILIVMLATLTGCWGREELNEIAIIHTLTIDKEENNNIRVTVEISQTVPQGQAPSGLRGNPVYLSEVGETLFDIARKLSATTSRTLIWGHISAIVFSKEVAKEGVQKHFDILTRLRHFRNMTNVYITDGKAKDILSAEVPLQKLTSIGLTGLIKAQKSNASTKRVTQMQVFQTLTNDYNDLTVPALHVYKHPITEKLNLRVGGMYVFAKDKLISYMDGEKTKSYLRAINESKEAEETLHSEEKKKSFSFENTHNSAKIIPNMQNGIPSVTIELHADFDVAEVQKETKIDPEQIEKWKVELNESLKEQMMAFISYTKKNKVDLIGIKEIVHRKYPKQWKDLEKDWNKIYPEIQFHVVVKSKIEHTFLLL